MQVTRLKVCADILEVHSGIMHIICDLDRITEQSAAQSTDGAALCAA